MTTADTVNAVITAFILGNISGVLISLSLLSFFVTMVTRYGYRAVKFAEKLYRQAMGLEGYGPEDDHERPSPTWPSSDYNPDPYLDDDDLEQGSKS